jgi:hypothetical protein
MGHRLDQPRTVASASGIAAMLWHKSHKPHRKRAVGYPRIVSGQRRFALLVMSALALLAVTTAGTAASASTSFSDVPSSHPFADEISWLVDHDITTGYDDGTFGGSRAITRQAMAAFLYRAAGEPDFSPPVTAAFLDVPSGGADTAAHPFYLEIEWLAAQGISTGYPAPGGSEFRPRAIVTRQAMAAFMYRLAGEPAITTPAAGAESFADVSAASGGQLAHPFLAEIEWMAQVEISTGFGVPGTVSAVFKPGANVTRQAMAAFIKRVAPHLNEPWGLDYAAECDDLLDNDGNELVDLDDPNCYGTLDNDESPPTNVPQVLHGNPEGGATIPAVAQPVDTSSPDTVIGNGTAASCTSAAVAAAVRSGGVIVFDCGPDPITIPLSQTLFTCNTTTCQHPWQGGSIVTRMVLDGGGLVTLSGQDQRGIFYANSCEEDFGWLSSRCDLETRPQIVFQNMGFVDGNASSGPAGRDGVGGGGGGGAIAMRGGQLIVINSHFSSNRCMTSHSDGGGGAIRMVGMEAPAYIVHTTIDDNRCANGGGVSSLHATVHVLNSLVTNNTATGSGASSGTGGNGGAIYFDGTSDNVYVRGTIVSGNVAPEGGPGVFYVSNDRSGHLTITGSQIVDNTGQSFYTHPYRDIFYLGKQSLPTVSNSTVE